MAKKSNIDADIIKQLSKRSKIPLCEHGINKSYCVACGAKAAKSKSKTSTGK